MVTVWPDARGRAVRFDHGTYWSACTIAGPRRARNADALALDLRGACLAFAVGDGVGGAPGAPLASATAVAAAIEWLARADGFWSEDIETLFSEVNRRVGEAMQSSRLEGATTLVAAAISQRGLVVAAVGDSEALLVPAAGPAVRLNHPDHLPARPNILLAWLDGQADFEPHAATLGSLGGTLCLVTDGVSGSLGTEALAGLVRSAAPSEAALRLTQAARDAGSTDDATAIVIGERIADEAARIALWSEFPEASA